MACKAVSRRSPGAGGACAGDLTCPGRGDSRGSGTRDRATAAAIWRLEQPPPPPGAPFKVPLGTPGDLKFFAPNRGLLGLEGNDTIPRGIFSWDGTRWRQLATVCGGPGDTLRIAFAGPREFWTVSEPSRPRFGSGLALCRFRDGQVVASYGTAPESADPFRQMSSATCNGANDCWFGGIGSQDPLGERVGAFHLHWNGSTLETVYGPQGRGVSDMEAHQGSVYESTYVGRGPENREEPVELAEPESPKPKLIHRIAGSAFANDPFEPADRPGVPADGTELLGLDSDGSQLWAVGGGAASGPSAPEDGSVARPPLAARLSGGAFGELTLTGATFTDSERFTDVAALPGTTSAFATVVPFAERRSVNAKAKVALIASNGVTTTTRLPVSGAGRGSAAKIACTGPNDCWLATFAGLALPLHRRDAAAARHRPGLPVDDRLQAQRGRRAVRAGPAARRRLPAVRPAAAGAAARRRAAGTAGAPAARPDQEDQVEAARAAR